MPRSPMLPDPGSAEVVRKAALIGVRQESIAFLIGISVSTLKRLYGGEVEERDPSVPRLAFRGTLAEGMAGGERRLLKHARYLALKAKSEAVQARMTMFCLKAIYGFKEGQIVELAKHVEGSGQEIDVSKLTPEERVTVRDALKKTISAVGDPANEQRSPARSTGSSDSEGRA